MHKLEVVQKDTRGVSALSAVTASLCCIGPLLALASGDSQPTPREIPPARISLYEVPLLCPAAPQIGCGSRAKPVLLSLADSSESCAI